MGVYNFSYSANPPRKLPVSRTLPIRPGKSVMSRFICPHCHSSLSADAMETAQFRGVEARVCPVCDGVVVLDAHASAIPQPPPAPAAPRQAADAAEQA